VSPGAIRLYLHLVGANVRAQMQYRVSFAIRTAADFGVLVADFLPIWFLVERFGALRGWSLAELALLYGMVSLSWGLVELSFQGLELFGAILVRGELDRWLVQPRPVLLQVAAAEFQLRRVGRISQALLVLAAAGVWLGLGSAAWSWVALGVTGGVAFFSGVLLLGAASQFFTLGQTSELQNMLTYGGTTLLSYPISIYSSWVRRVATFAVPLAFVNYYPALAALGRGDAGGPGLAPWLAPFVCAGVLALGLAAFAAGLRRYESTGT
jgi:ABC-2 type transport system permease protein